MNTFLSSGSRALVSFIPATWVSNLALGCQDLDVFKDPRAVILRDVPQFGCDISFRPDSGCVSSAGTSWSGCCVLVASVDGTRFSLALF